MVWKSRGNAHSIALRRVIKALYNAAKGNMKKGYAFAGSNAFLADKISSVKEVMNTLEREFFLATHKLV